MTPATAFLLGKMRGYDDGSERAGQYVVGEEFKLSFDAAEEQSFGNLILENEWAAGYRVGYVRAAHGEEL